MAPRITASESAYGLLAWLTSRKEAVTLSAHHDASAAAELARRWCEANALPEPRGGVYPQNITMP